MPAPKGHPPYPGCGQPRKYDIDKIGKELVEWSKLETSVYLGEFVIDQGFDPDNLYRWSNADENFAECLKTAKLRIAYRLRRKLHDKDNPYNYGLFMREIGMYDKILRDFERSEKEKDVKLKIQLEKESFESQKSTARAFLDAYVEKSEDKKD